MKKRFRHYARNGWEIVEIDRANLWKWDGDGDGFGNTRHYKDLRSWCHERLPKGSWEATFLKPSGLKKFAFQNPKHATMFRLHWL